MPTNRPLPPSPPPIPALRARRNSNTILNSSNITRKLSFAADKSTNPAAASSPLRKKVKVRVQGQSADEILKDLAKSAVHEMKMQQLRQHRATGEENKENEPCWDSRIGDKYDCLLPNCLQEDEEEADAPQSPLSFLKRVGLYDGTPSKRRQGPVLTPPRRPPIIDKALKDALPVSIPSSCTTPESGSPRRNPAETVGDITPATAHAAQCLLELKR